MTINVLISVLNADYVFYGTSLDLHTTYRKGIIKKACSGFPTSLIDYISVSFRSLIVCNFQFHDRGVNVAAVNMKCCAAVMEKQFKSSLVETGQRLKSNSIKNR